jgi:hypothetical protein
MHCTLHSKLTSKPSTQPSQSQLLGWLCEGCDIAVQTGIKIFRWLATLYGFQLTYRTTCLWALGFLFPFTIGRRFRELKYLLPLSGIEPRFLGRSVRILTTTPKIISGSFCLILSKSCPVTGLDWSRGFQEVKVRRFHDNGTGRW